MTFPIRMGWVVNDLAQGGITTFLCNLLPSLPPEIQPQFIIFFHPFTLSVYRSKLLSKYVRLFYCGPPLSSVLAGPQTQSTYIITEQSLPHITFCNGRIPPDLVSMITTCNIINYAALGEHTNISQPLLALLNQNKSQSHILHAHGLCQWTDKFMTHMKKIIPGWTSMYSVSKAGSIRYPGAHHIPFPVSSDLHYPTFSPRNKSFLSVCRFDHIKNIPHSAELTQKIHPLDVYGDGYSYTEILQQLSKYNHVTVKPWTDDVLPLYNSYRCFINTSTNEGGPLTIVEALLCLLPCYTTSVGIMPELSLLPKSDSLLCVSSSPSPEELRSFIDRSTHPQHKSKRFEFRQNVATYFNPSLIGQKWLFYAKSVLK